MRVQADGTSSVRGQLPIRGEVWVSRLTTVLLLSMLSRTASAALRVSCCTPRAFGHRVCRQRVLTPTAREGKKMLQPHYPVL